jgi:hypothetical protein
MNIIGLAAACMLLFCLTGWCRLRICPSHRIDPSPALVWTWLKACAKIFRRLALPTRHGGTLISCIHSPISADGVRPPVLPLVSRSPASHYSPFRCLAIFTVARLRLSRCSHKVPLSLHGTAVLQRPFLLDLCFVFPSHLTPSPNSFTKMKWISLFVAVVASAIAVKAAPVGPIGPCPDAKVDAILNGQMDPSECCSYGWCRGDVVVAVGN